MTEVRSHQATPTVIEDYVALGDEVTVYAGVHLAGEVSVYPRLKIPNGIRVPRGAELATADDVLRYL